MGHRFPPASSYVALQTMRANRRTDTKPELMLRSALHRRGLRFRKDFKLCIDGISPVRPDVVFTRARVAIFIDGCFWHRCPEHYQRPRANREFWDQKIARSVERDISVDAALKRSGWIVLRFWEHTAIDEITERVAEVVGAQAESRRDRPRVEPAAARAEPDGRRQSACRAQS